MIATQSLSARVGAFTLSDVSFEVPEGRYGVVIGPAGSGKTTLLETIAGVVPQRGGRLLLNGTDATALPPEARNVALVYQHGFLFPHLSVRDNIAYGARDPAVVQEVERRLRTDALADRDIRGLSGGERQLVALARALARRPGILLLDEPFSSLDPRRRTGARREIRAIHREWGMTVLHVTHDFTEAGLLGDVAILLDTGRVLQHGSPDAVFRRPASAYVAEFLGAENVFAGQVMSLGGTDDGGHRALEFRGALTLFAIGDAEPGAGHAVIRAEEVVLSRHAQASSARNHFAGPIVEIATSGALTRVTLDVDGTPLVAALTTRSVDELGLEVGQRVHALFKATAVHLC